MIMNNLPTTLQCPFCDGSQQCKLVTVPRMMVAQGQEYYISYYKYRCAICAGEFTTTDSDAAVLSQFPGIGKGALRAREKRKHKGISFWGGIITIFCFSLVVNHYVTTPFIFAIITAKRVGAIDGWVAGAGIMLLLIGVFFGAWYTADGVCRLLEYLNIWAAKRKEGQEAKKKANDLIKEV